MTELEIYIASYFGIINQNELSKIASLFVKTDLAKADFLLQSGNHCDVLGFVQSGFLRMYSETEDKEITQWISTKGSFVTDLSSFIFGNTTKWNIQALSNSELYIISKLDYENIKNVAPKWAELEKLFITKCFTAMENRIFSFLSLSAEERYNLLYEQNREIFNQVPLQYLASMLGMSAETLSRIRKK
ncbi:Crp/Fnr family transcriptional regulator [Flavobacterium sp.]|uniref:Crp/Fnr family transcriptional regulator n=1 Tax=Flavobacterium sp. TaxID=239 RepID=UPI003750A8D6